jgi:hypothetical protein
MVIRDSRTRIFYRSPLSLSAYEELRRRVLAGASACDLGQIFLVREGMTAWLAHQTTCATPVRPAADQKPCVAGATTTFTLPRPLTPQQQRATHPGVRQQIDALLEKYTDAQLADRLQLRFGEGKMALVPTLLAMTVEGPASARRWCVRRSGLPLRG